MITTVAQALQAALRLGLDRLDAQLLLLHALGKRDSERAWLLAYDDYLLPAPAARTFEQFIQRRMAGEPLAYIVGYKEFFGLRLQVDARVLVPRPDTETLVEWALEILLKPDAASRPKILDLGCGSGAIALALAHAMRARGQPAEVTAVDASREALNVAQENASLLQLDVCLTQGHWLEDVSACFQLIVSNPPYIASADPHLVGLRHEPLQALAAGPDGLDDLREIIQTAPGHLTAGGWLLLEHGYDQSERVLALLAERGFRQLQVRRDLAGIVRCSGGRWPG